MALQRRALEVGLGFWSMQRSYVGPSAGPAVYRHAAAEVQLAEALGFDSVWVSEHHFSYDDYGPSPLTACGFLAGATARIAVGTCILALPLHDPDRVAAALGALKAIAPGRVRLGVGLGYREIEFSTFGQSMKQRARLMEERLDALLAAGALDGVELWIGGVSEAAVVRAARYGASLFLPPMVGPPEAVAQLRSLWESNLCRREEQNPRLGLFVQAWPEDDAGRAATIRAQAVEEWRSYARFFVEDPILGASGADRDQLAAGFAALALVGPADDLVEQLAPYERAGVDLFILWPRFGAMPHDTVRRSIELLGTKVMPALRGLR